MTSRPSWGTSAATRQLASRARRRVQGAAPPDAELARQRHTVARFVAALRDGDVPGLLAILDPDVLVRFGEGVPALDGARLAAETWSKGATAFRPFADQFVPTLVDGAVGLVLAPKGRPVRALRFLFVDGRIARADIVAERAQLAALALVPLAAPATDPAAG